MIFFSLINLSHSMFEKYRNIDISHTGNLFVDNLISRARIVAQIGYRYSKMRNIPLKYRVFLALLKIEVNVKLSMVFLVYTIKV